MSLFSNRCYHPFERDDNGVFDRYDKRIFDRELIALVEKVLSLPSIDPIREHSREGLTRILMVMIRNYSREGLFLSLMDMNSNEDLSPLSMVVIRSYSIEDLSLSLTDMIRA